MQDFQLCPYCGQPLRLVWVHGHGQCAVCHTNVDECCRGESQESEGVPKQAAENPAKSPVPNPAQDAGQADERASEAKQDAPEGFREEEEGD